MSEYQVLARKYRPQRFSEVIAQDAIVTTLKNAIKHERLAHAYLFCGSRGTGKTTLARVFAKALNCENRTQDFEPCGSCTSCREITIGSSLDVIEIDGASHRGIDDIREINDNVSYSSTSGRKKIYIIDEVHMLTKEAFNALLKTLEEPPPQVMFFFATTEPHKVLPTILSRCQRFNLSRIPQEAIVQKLQSICNDQKISAEKNALQLIAKRAEGGLRDAESLLDQILAFHEGDLTLKAASESLGVMEDDCFFELDLAQKNGDLSVAFKIAERIFSEGKDLVHFVEGLTEHFRNILLIQLTGQCNVAPQETLRYSESAKLYSKEQCLEILEYLIEKQAEIRFMPSPRIGLEGILLKVLRSRYRISIESLVKKLCELEAKIESSPMTPLTEKQEPIPNIVTASAPISDIDTTKASVPETPFIKPVVANEALANTSKEPVLKPIVEEPSFTKTADTAKELSKAPTVKAPTVVTSLELPKEAKAELMIDPDPTPADLNIKNAAKKTAALPTPPVNTPPLKIDNPSRLDTMLQFAAVELDGSIQRRQFTNT